MDRFTFFGNSDIGLGRSKNEDVWVAAPKIGFFAIADGMGGHRAGEVAAKQAIYSLVESVSATPQPIDDETLRSAIEAANRWIYKLGKENEVFKGMGTTLCCLWWIKGKVLCAHAGDSRIYRLTEKKLEKLTEDHSLWNRWQTLGEHAKHCKTPFPYKHVITKALGTKNKTNPEIISIPMNPSDIFLLCSDGLTDVVSEEEIKNILLSSTTMQEKGKLLIEKAKLKGSRDNITALIVQLDENHLPR